MKNMFKKRWTKWMPFGNYTWAGNTCYMVFVRKNLKTGMMQWKTKMIHSWWRSKEPFVPNLIDVKEAWEEISNK